MELTVLSRSPGWILKEGLRLCGLERECKSERKGNGRGREGVEDS